MQLCGVVLFLQTLHNFFSLAASAPAGLQEKASGLESAPQWQASLQKEFGISLKVSQQIFHKTHVLSCDYLSSRLSRAKLILASYSEVLPSASLNFSSWISLSNTERLSHMAKMLEFYHGLLKQLKVYEETKEDSKFTARLEELGLYLRDLGHHVNYQISLWGLPRDSLEPTLKPPQILQHWSRWRNRLEVNYVLHSLKNLMCRIMRDFLLLRTEVARSLPVTLESHSSTF